MNQNMDNALEFPIQPLLIEGGDSALDEAYINGVCAGLSFRSLLNYNSFDPEAAETENRLKIPKTETLPTEDFSHYFTDPAPSSTHLHLPNLLSLEPPQNSSTAAATESPILNPTIDGKQRRRRPQPRLSDKTRSLQKLLPWDEKMDMATVLEEAYKYIRFLEAQVSVLQSMPCGGVGGTSAAPASIGGSDLGRLNRQQLLQVVLNSPVAQAQLYSKGCCIYSVEQLVWMRRNAERKQALFQQMLFGSSNANPFL